MLGATTGSNELELAGILVPFLTLIVIFSVDSVEDLDSFTYRAIVGFLGIAMIGPIFIVLIRGIAATQDLSTPTSSGWYAIYTLIAMLLLVIVVVIVETSRGLEERDVFKYGLAILGMTLIWYGFLSAIG